MFVKVGKIPGLLSLMTRPRSSRSVRGKTSFRWTRYRLACRVFARVYRGKCEDGGFQVRYLTRHPSSVYWPGSVISPSWPTN
jgi:hypothetical protein